MFARLITHKLLELLDSFRCLVLAGARQVGKTFLLKQLAQQVGGEYRTFDDPLIRKEASDDALGWLQRNRIRGQLFVIDEAIKSPEIFNAVKLIVDQEDPTPTQIILASSGNYLLLRQVKESLAGRVALLKMFPLSWSEINKSTPSKLNLLGSPKLFHDLHRSESTATIDRQREKFLLEGGFPEVHTRNSTEFTREWIRQYFNTYVLPLAVDLFRIGKQHSFELVFQQLALRTGQLLRYSNIASGSEVSSVYREKLYSLLCGDDAV